MLNRNSQLITGIIFIFLLFWNTSLVFSQSKAVPLRKGWWNFNDTQHLTNPVTGFGQPLQLVGSHSMVNGPAASDYAVKIGVGSHYIMTHGMASNGGGNFINEYSLQIDFKVPATDVWHCFYQTSPQNNNDGDCFINPTGHIGVAATGYSPDAVTIDEWYRMVITVDNGNSYSYYLDGILINQAVVQDVDGRFSLDSILLMFADEDGEDNEIIVSEIAIWDQVLSQADVTNLGSFWHPSPDVNQFIGYPFLQAKTSNSIYVCWHDTAQTITRVEYGINQQLGSFTDGTSEIVSFPYRWHSVPLTNLTANTRYYYRIVSGSLTSSVFSFKTLPANDYNGHIRFLLFSDSQSDSAATGMIVRNAKQKVQEFYGDDIDNEIDLIMHSGDIVGDGSNISSWSDEFFRPFAPLSANIPFLSVIGNHELEHRNYYTYMKYDAFSAFPAPHPLNEKIWSYRMPHILFIGLNTNVIWSYGSEQITWLDQTLANAEQDAEIDFVFCFLHHPPVSEIWVEGNTAYVSDEVLPVLQKYSKVQQLSYGHTHAYERGVIESKAENTIGDFRISCVGGGGGWRDRWGEYANFDYPQVHTAIDHYFYVLYDIDLENVSYDGYMFDLGNTNLPATNQVLDQWHRRLNQEKPQTPTALEPTYSREGHAVLHATAFSGQDDVMSSDFQLTSASGDYTAPLFESSRNWQNVYGVDNQFHAVDLNEGIDLSEVQLTSGLLEMNKKYYYRVRYRDQNLRWSDWSTEMEFTYTGAEGIDSQNPKSDVLKQNSPNPANNTSTIDFGLSRPQTIRLEIKDLQGRSLMVLAEGEYQAGYQSIPFVTAALTEGCYMYSLRTETSVQTRKMQIVR
jgi:hypothetical protein